MAVRHLNNVLFIYRTSGEHLISSICQTPVFTFRYLIDTCVISLLFEYFPIVLLFLVSRVFTSARVTVILYGLCFLLSALVRVTLS